ncbi:MAG: hypothetical protein R3E60_03905 [Alphaproteobacteria bacterium]
MAKQNYAILSHVSANLNEENRIMALAVPLCLAASSWLTHRILCAQTGFAESEKDFLYKTLMQENMEMKIDVTVSPASFKKTKLHALRQIFRTATWTSLKDMPETFLNQQSIVISHNPLLIEDLKYKKISARFIHGEQILNKYLKSSKENLNQIEEITEKFINLYINIPELTDLSRQVLAKILHPRILKIISYAQNTLNSLLFWNAPKRLFSATGSSFPARALGLEVQRRGGEVVRYDHGGHTFLVRNTNATILELVPSTKFVTFTKDMARYVETESTRSKAPWCQIESGKGDPFLGKATAVSHSHLGKNKKVLYIPGILLSQRELYPPIPAAPVYLDWQMKVARTLSRLPIYVCAKPHPGGLLRGMRHPLESVIPVSYQPFEKVMPDFNVLIFDNPTSTTFSYALCSQTPIIYLDHGIVEYKTEFTELLKKRCIIVPVAWDEKNSPILDEQILTDAVMARFDPIDPTPFQHLFVSDEA